MRQVVVKSLERIHLNPKLKPISVLGFQWKIIIHPRKWVPDLFSSKKNDKPNTSSFYVKPSLDKVIVNKFVWKRMNSAILFLRRHKIGVETMVF